MDVTISKGKHAIEILNVYVPPIRHSNEDARTQEFKARNLPWNADIIAGDFNAHSALWDEIKDKDDIGKDIANTSEDHNYEILNNGHHTLISKAHGTLSTPDVTMCKRKWKDRITWQTLEDHRSDHLPISISLTLDIKNRENNNNRKTRYNLKKANWEEYQKQTEEALNRINMNKKNINKLYAEICKTILKAANNTIPKSGKTNAKLFWNDACNQAVKDRRKARKNLERNPGNEEKRQQWIKASQESKKIINEEREKSWRMAVSKFNLRTDARKVWKTIKAIDGKRAQRKTPALKTDTLKLRPSKKAECLAHAYRKTSRLQIEGNTAHLKKIKREVYRRMKEQCYCQGKRTNDCSPFTEQELTTALKNLNTGKAPGEDGITNDLIIQLNNKSRSILLLFINKCWKEGRIPQQWKRAIIIPILKPGKMETDPGSYRPISLTSCLCKINERMVLNRLNWLIDSKEIMNPNQAGFQKHKSTEDQLVRIQQEILDGFNNRPKAKRTLMVLIDFSRAFDTVWRKGLLLKLLDYKIPKCMIKWIKEFLSDRTARVEIEGTKSKPFKLEEGVPQGGVISPKLFTLFINDITQQLPETVHTSLFADDLALWVQNEDKDKCKEIMQTALNTIVNWTTKWAMTINETKCEYLLLSTWNKEWKWETQLTINNKRIKRNDHPKFLGVQFDWNLNFSKHTIDTVNRMKQRLKPLRAVATKKWGCNNEDLRTLYLGYIRTLADYAAASWQTATSDTNIKQLETVQNEAARIITGCNRSTPTEFLHHEADLQPFSQTRMEKAAIAYQKFIRHDRHPNKALAEKIVRPRIKRSKDERSWRDIAKNYSAKAGLSDIIPESLLLYSSNKPWVSLPLVEFRDSLLTKCNKKDDPTILHRYTQETLQDINLNTANYIIWTDGSVKEDQKNGGSGALIEIHNQATIELKKPAGKFCSSFVSELRAIEMALNKVLEHRENNHTNDLRDYKTIILTDSQSSIKELKKGPHNQSTLTGDKIWNTINSLNSVTIFQWIPSHVGTTGNEQVDKLAKEATDLPQDQVAINFNTARGRIRKLTREQYKKTNMGEQRNTWMATKDEAAEKNMNRNERTALAQIRSGHSTLLAAYRSRIDGNQSPICECGIGEETLSHWINCDQHTNKRVKIWGAPTVTMDMIKSSQLLKYMRDTGKLPAI